MPKRETPWRRPELQAITDHAEDFVQVFDLDLRQRFVNRTLADALAREPADLVGRTLSESGISAKVTAQWERQLRRVIETGEPQVLEFEGRTRAGRRSLSARLTPVRGRGGRVRAITAITRDVTEWKRAEALHQGQHEVMRALAAGASLNELFTSIVRRVESHAPQRVCSILLLDADGSRLRPAHAPNLPATLVEALCTAPIGPANGCCGAAAATRRTAISADIASDPAWASLRELALAHKLRACWSQPILARDGRLLGTFAMYHRRAREPYPAELQVTAEAALLAGIALQHHDAQRSLLEIRDRYETITAYATNLLAVTDMDGAIQYVSPSCLPMLGFQPEELLGRNLYLGVHRDDVPAALETYRKLRDEVGAQVSFVSRYRHRDGSWRTFEVSAKSRFDHRGRYIAVVSGRDITEREATERALRESEERLDRALEGSGLGMWEWDVEGGRFHIDERCARALGYEPGEIDPTYETLTAIIHPDDALRVARTTEAHLRGETPHLDYQCRILTRARHWTWVHTRGRAIRDAAGVPWRVTGTTKNVDAERAMEQRLAQAHGQMQQLLGATDEGIIGLDRDGVITFVNPAAMRMLQLPSEQLLGHNFDERIRHTAEDGHDLIGHDSHIVHCLLEGQRYIGTNEMFSHPGMAPLPVEYSVSPLIEDGQPAGAVLIFRDVTEKRALAQQLEHQALHDPLTGLVNRRGFEQKLSELLRSARQEHREHALCYLDLDHFKVVNDTCGHAAGDELLRQLPQVLRQHIQHGDTLARVGGDEFALLLEDCPLDKAGQVAETLRNAIRDFRFVWQYRTFTIGVSIGVVGVGPASQGLVSVLGAADAACYVAKDHGPNHVHVSLPHDLAIIRRRGEMRWVARIKNALDEDQFQLHYMSIAPLQVEAPPKHHELLLRLADPRGGLVLPGSFLPAAERYQLVPQIDRWVIEHALRQLGSAAAGQPALREHRFGINLSGDSLRDPRLLEYIQGCLARNNVPPEMVYFEFTETAAIANLRGARDFMHGLRELGCTLALDDFGSGMSSFSYLKHLPVDYLKIDGGFIRDVCDNPVDQSIVRAVQAVGKQVGISTVAEYVETAAIRDCLRDMGLHYAQGHAIALPAPLAEFPLLRQPQAAAG